MSNVGDNVTVTTHTNWFRRVLNSVIGVLVGIVMVLVSTGVLFWNEGRAVTTARSLAEGRAAVVSVPADAVDPANEGRLVHVTGTSTVEGTVSDSAFGISATGLALVRVAEMYQWTEKSRSETRTTLGGSEERVTTYTYSQEWSDSPVDSSDFHAPMGHENPPMELRGERFQVDSAGFGAFTLGRTTIDAIDESRALPVRKDEEAALAAAFGAGERPVRVVSGKIFVAENPDRPAIGDLRISYALVPAGPLSIVAMQPGATFGSYQTRSGDAIQLVETGLVPAGDMFAHAETENSIVTWIVRFVGLLVMFIGFALIAAPLSVLASVVPFLGDLVGVGTMALGFAATLLLGGGTIAVAWLVFRPLVALGVLAAAALLVAGILALARRRAAAAPPAAAPSAASG